MASSSSSLTDDIPNDILEDADALSPDFRARLGLLSDDEEGLSPRFMAHIGMVGLDEVAEQEELQMPQDSLEEKDEDLSQYKFSRFVMERFQSGNTSGYSKDDLRQPLLTKKHEVDRLASLSVWKAIQKFMSASGGAGLAEKTKDERDKLPVMTRIYRTLETYAKRKSIGTNSTDSNSRDTVVETISQKNRKRNSLKKVIHALGSRSTEKEKSNESATTTTGNSMANHMGSSVIDYANEKLPNNELDLIHYIIGHAILRKDLRDELYCQLCKQLTNNPSTDAESRGWILLCLSVGCFLPTDDFLKFLKNFLREALPPFKTTHAMFARKLLRRTQAFGPRYHPPNWLEYQAAKLRKYVMLPVIFADGHMETLETDSATTAGQMCGKLASKIGLRDQFGFSIYICIHNKVSSMGSGTDHVMDAISECEQVVRSKGGSEEDAPWRLYFRKELFTPWHDPCYDSIATNLIYLQVSRGIRAEEYKIKGDELPKFAAQKFFVEKGNEATVSKVNEVLERLIPAAALRGSETKDQWSSKVVDSFKKQNFHKMKISQQKVKEMIVTTATKLWPLQFSGLFEAFKISGPKLTKNDIVVAINSRGFFILDDPFQISVGLHFSQIVEVSASRSGKVRGQTFSLVTIKGDEYSFVSPNSQTIAHLLAVFLEGLRKRSSYAVGIQEFVMQGSEAEPFRFRQGDLIEMMNDETGAFASKPDWAFGQNCRTAKQGAFPLDCVYIIPTLERPPEEFLNIFSQMTAKDVKTLPRKRGIVRLSKGTIGRHHFHGKETSA